MQTTANESRLKLNNPGLKRAGFHLFPSSILFFTFFSFHLIPFASISFLPNVCQVLSLLFSFPILTYSPLLIFLPFSLLRPSPIKHMEVKIICCLGKVVVRLQLPVYFKTDVNSYRECYRFEHWTR